MFSFTDILALLEYCRKNQVDEILHNRLPQRLKKTDKTTGILVAGDHEVELISGFAGPAESLPIKSPGFNIVTMTHAEGHAVAFMQQNGIREARIYINNTEVYSSCENT